ncbi:MAG: copper resistance protein CopC [Thermoleophilia bacterium]
MTARTVLTAAMAAAALAGAAAPAFAHDELASSSPKRGATVAHLPATVKLNFTEAVPRVVGARLLVAGSKTNRARKAKLNPANARQVLITTTGDAVGQYTVVAHIIAPDGDAQAVVYRFRVKR